MSGAIGNVCQELAEVSASLKCVKDKLTAKLDEAVGNIEEVEKTREAVRDPLFDPQFMADWSKGRVGEVEDLIEGLRLRIREIGDLTADLLFDTDEIEAGNVGSHSKGLEDSDEIEI
uniref:Uncharacterized protein n=1 Tax=Physcomitrium patens TaxID=3218 RepID=A9RFI2_PHYPA|nr:hypothetical protein PHYPA_030525 [Physcomitrium patens]